MAVSEWRVWLPGKWPGYTELQGRQGSHFGYRKMKLAWQEGAALLIKAARIPHLEAATLLYQHHRPDRRHDKSNLAFGAAKIIEDAIVDAGVLDDDGWNYVLDFDHKFQVASKPGILLTIRAAP